VDAGGLLHELVEGRGDEVGELNLGDRAGLVHSGAHGRANDNALGQRRVDHPHGAVLIVEPFRHPEHPAALAHILTENEDARVFGHHLVDRLADRFQEVYLWHVRVAPPCLLRSGRGYPYAGCFPRLTPYSAYTCFSSVSGSG